MIFFCPEIIQNSPRLTVVVFFSHQGMDIIETMNHEAFTAYLKRTGNTICGRHPIGVFLGALNAMKQLGTNGFVARLKFLNYDQSNACKSMQDSSVSYAAAAFTLG